MTAWLPAAAELDAYEGIRRGDEDAFRALAGPLQPTLRRLACLYVGSGTGADAVVLRSWEGALRGLHMFQWHTPLASWIAGIVVASGRAHVSVEAPSARPTTPAPAREVPGPPDWSDLPWSARWERAAVTLAGALEALPLDQREVAHGRDVERWPPRRVCDVFGLPEVIYERLLAEARTRLRDALALLVGQAGPGRHHPAQIGAVTGWLNTWLVVSHEQLDPRTVAVFRRWRAKGRTGRRLSQPLRGPLSPSVPIITTAR